MSKKSANFKSKDKMRFDNSEMMYDAMLDDCEEMSSNSVGMGMCV